MLHPRRCAQEVLLCDLCETAPLESHCELCHINLCVNCVEKHISDLSKKHYVRPYLQRKSTPNYPKCPKHTEKYCELHCEKCDIPVCSTCALFGKHKGHDISDILEKLSTKTQTLQKDLEELETTIVPRYEEMASNIRTEKSALETNYTKLKTDADQQGEMLHQKITAIVNQRNFDIQEMKNKDLFTLNKNSEEITQKITELKQIIADLKSILKSKDVSLTSTYKSRNSEYRTLPSQVRVTLPNFYPGEINKDQLDKMFGSLSSLSISTEHDIKMKSPKAASPSSIKPMKSPEAILCPQIQPLLGQPRLTSTTDTGYEYLTSVSCHSEETVWTCGNNQFMKLINLQGKLLTSIKTKSGNWPGDIAVTRCGDLVYTDPSNKTVNVVKNKQIRTLITLQEWEPRYICRTVSDDFLVTMISGDLKQSKVVRYSGSIETQTIQFDDQARPLYSSDLIKHISENRNLDICVADNGAKAVVVVNQSGKFRFRYTGHPSNTKISFYPRDIATDSHSRILTADWTNHGIHILDQDGQFLRYIHNLRHPCGICVDIRDNLFVAEWDTAKVKKIQYL